MKEERDLYMKRMPIEFLIEALLIVCIFPVFAQKFLNKWGASETCMKKKLTNTNENCQQVPDERFNTIGFSEEMKSLNDIDKKVSVEKTAHAFLLDTKYCSNKIIAGLEGRLPFSSELHVYPNSVKSWYKVQSATPRIFYDAAISGKRGIEIKSIHNFGKEKARVNSSLAVIDMLKI